MIEFSGYHGGVNNERNGLVDIEKVVEKWSGFLRHGDMGMVAEDRLCAGLWVCAWS